MKSLKKNIMYNSIYQFLILFLPFITAPYLSRVIGPNGVGTYSYSQSIAQYFVYIAMLGLNNYGNRSIASVNDDRTKRSIVFSEIYSMQLMTSIISIFIYCIYILITKDKSALIMLMYVISAAFDINWLFFGTENFKISVLRNAAIKIVSMMAIFTFVKCENDTYIYVGIMASSILASQLVLWPFVHDVVDIQKSTFNHILKHFRPNLMLFTPVIAISIYKIMDKVMLGSMVSTSSVGIFEYGEKIYNIPLTLITAVGTVMLPRMTYYYSNGREEDAKKYLSLSMEYVLAFANAAMFGLMAISNNFVELYYGHDFCASSIVINYLAVTIIFLSAGNVLRTQYLIPKKLDNIYIRSAVYGAVINFILNLLLIPKMDYIGASWGTIAAEVIVFFYQFWAIRKDIDIKKYLKIEFRYLFLGIIMFFSIYKINIYGNLITLIIKIVVGGGIYLIGFIALFFIIYKNSPLKYFKQNIK